MRLCVWSIAVFLLIASDARPGRSDTAYPPEFKSKVPVFQSAKAVDVRYTRNSVTVEFISQAKFKQVMTFYTIALKEPEWKIRALKEENKLVAASDRTILTLKSSEVDGRYTIHLLYPGGRD